MLVQQWARAEAITRNEMKENGEEITFGTYYNNNKINYAEGESLDGMPVMADRS